MQKIYNCVKRGHYTSYCQYKKVKGNVATSSKIKKGEEEVQDYETSYVVEETNQ